MPIVIGQDAEAAALQRILAGDQTFTIYKPIKRQAEAAAELAVKAVRRQLDLKPPAGVGVNNGKRWIESVLLAPMPIDKAHVKRVLEDGFLQREAVCTPAYAEQCRLAGI